MNHVRFGKTGLLVSELCLGTMTFGNEADEDTSRRLMDAALDRGINFFDTAHNYNKGLTEEIVGGWIGPHRDRLILASKVFFPFGGGINDEGLSRRNIIASAERSLRRLRTDYLDILYLHHWDGHVPVGESMRALNTLIEQGKVRYGGVSNFSAWQTVEAQRAADRLNLHPLVCAQPMYSLLKRQVEVEILPMASHEGLAVVPYNALGAGMLTGKYMEGGTGRLNEAEMYRQRYADPSYGETTRRFVAHARNRGDAPAALAAAWVMAHPAVTSTLFGARSAEQFEETLGCLDIRLSAEERAEISALSPTPPDATDRESMEAMRSRGW